MKIQFLLRLVTFSLLAGCLLPARVLAEVFLVNSTNASGPGTLEQAILDANANPGPDNISFAIPGAGTQTILLRQSLPVITDPVVIDGSTQPGYAGVPLVFIAGGSDCLSLTASNCVIRALALDRFNTGIRIQGGGNNVVEGCFIGAGSDGIGPGQVLGSSVVITGSSGNRIGGPAASQRNIISTASAVLGAGIFLNAGANDCLIQGNFIGVAANGTNYITYAGQGYGLQLAGVTNTTVVGNVVSGCFDAIFLANSSETRVKDNFIGVDAAATVGIQNARYGILLQSGGTNLISSNIISGNVKTGIAVQKAQATTIQGNHIGTDITGLKAIPNGTGISSAGNVTVQIGGSEPGTGNLISGNEGPGVLAGELFNRGTFTVKGNWVGVDASGQAALPNGGDGLIIYSRAQIGGPELGARNVVSGNTSNGIVVIDVLSTVQGNYVGTDFTGHNAVPNGLSGVQVVTSSGQIASPTLIGGTNANDGNLLSGNLHRGLSIGSTSRPVSGISVVGNRIGVRSKLVESRWPGSGKVHATVIPVGPFYEPLPNGDVAVYCGPLGAVFSGTIPKTAIGDGTDAGKNVIGLSEKGRGIVVEGGVGVDIDESDFVCNGCSPENLIDTSGAASVPEPPVLSSVKAALGELKLEGSFHGVPNLGHSLLFYNFTGSGASYLGREDVKTDAMGVGSFLFTTPLPVTPGSVIAQSTSSKDFSSSAFSVGFPLNVQIPNRVEVNAVFVGPDPSGRTATVTVSLQRGFGNNAPQTKVHYRTEPPQLSPFSSGFFGIHLVAAEAAIDYESVEGDLIFGPLETEKQIVVPLLSGPIVSGTKIFTLLLSDPSSDAVLGQRVAFVFEQPNRPANQSTFLIDRPILDLKSGMLTFPSWTPGGILEMAPTVRGPWISFSGLTPPWSVGIPDQSGFVRIMPPVVSPDYVTLAAHLVSSRSNSFVVSVADALAEADTNNVVTMTNLPPGNVRLTFTQFAVITNDNTGSRSVHQLSIVYDILDLGGRGTINIPIKVEIAPFGELPPSACDCLPWAAVAGATVNGIQRVVASGGKSGVCDEQPVVSISGPGGIQFSGGAQRQEISPAPDGTYTVTTTICGATKTVTITLP